MNAPEDILDLIVAEAMTAHDTYGPLASMHEGYGVLAEEVAELFEALRMGPNTHGVGKDGKMMSRGECIKAEAIQVAAVALRIAAQAEKVTR